LKIDRAFVSRVDSDQDTYEIVRIIVMLAHNLGLTVVAEGVETLAQLDLIRKVGCERAQGYLFSRPVDHHTILKLLEANRSTPAGFQFKAAILTLSTGCPRLGPGFGPRLRALILNCLITRRITF
jgi:predicted signal transduction protein with EAL and GGDEF domain